MSEWFYVRLDPDSGRIALGPRFLHKEEVETDLLLVNDDPHDRVIGSVEEGGVLVISDEGQSDVMVYVRLPQQEAQS